MLTNVYVDGFNLYYTAVKDTLNKWLVIADLCRRLLPQNTVNHIYYSTRHVSSLGRTTRKFTIDNRSTFGRSERFPISRLSTADF